MSDSKSFNENLLILKTNAEKLRTQTDIDIDALVPLVEQSTEAYKICKERIESVRLSLSKHLAELGNENTDAGN